MDEINGSPNQNMDNNRDESIKDTNNLSSDDIVIEDNVISNENDIASNSDSENPVQLTPEQKKKKLITEVLQWVQAIAVAGILAYLIHAFVFERALVDGDSMVDTLKDDQNLIEYKLGYLFHAPKRGDIVVFEYEKGVFNKYLPLPDPQEKDYIKRVIGLPGETVDLRDGYVYIDDKKLDEPYAKGLTEKSPNAESEVVFPMKVEPGTVFVMGDNRQNSSDSRTFGLVDFSSIRGKAVLRVYPFNEFGSIYNNLKK